MSDSTGWRSSVSKLAPPSEPVREPDVDPDFTTLPAIERCTETMRFQMLRLEYAVAPDGLLRRCLGWGLRIGLCLAVLALTLVPVITYMLETSVTWANLAFTAATQLLKAVLAIAACVALVLFGVRRLGR